ncbi:hypothetical protein BQ8482_420016 [Mesorhizobium delmotii]|uniref:Uncharacterized protein n=1 Tax=Mesorhizobium delmotii TaxID=1631247 RepID=A0A2P9ATC5_9HYPH|nr:hypothetical protein BQ8482_420016 [Mesorhizobium delmotii]
MTRLERQGSPYQSFSGVLGGCLAGKTKANIPLLATCLFWQMNRTATSHPFRARSLV